MTQLRLQYPEAVPLVKGCGRNLKPKGGSRKKNEVVSSTKRGKTYGRQKKIVGDEPDPSGIMVKKAAAAVDEAVGDQPQPQLPPKFQKVASSRQSVRRSCQQVGRYFSSDSEPESLYEANRLVRKNLLARKQNTNPIEAAEDQPGASDCMVAETAKGKGKQKFII